MTQFRYRRSLPALFGFACIVLLAGCKTSPLDRQDPLSVRGSMRVAPAPEAKSVTGHYKPAPYDAPPNPRSAYHVPPVFFYEDRPLSDNLVSAIELADFEAAVIRAGYWPYLDGGKDHTVLAVPNEPFEMYRHEDMPDLMKPAKHAYLAGLIGQMILIGHWDLPTIRQQAAKKGGSIQVPTLAGPGHDVILKPMEGGGVEVIGKDGTVTLTGNGYRQSNGVLYVTDSILPYYP